jgi:hypothetical protein
MAPSAATSELDGARLQPFLVPDCQRIHVVALPLQFRIGLSGST